MADVHDFNEERAKKEELKRIASLTLANDREIAIKQFVQTYKGATLAAVRKDVAAITKLLEEAERKAREKKGWQKGQEPRALEELLGSQEEVSQGEWIASLNKQYVFALEQGAALVLKQTFDGLLKRDYFLRLKPADFKLAYCNIKIRAGVNAKGEPVYKGLGDVWFESRLRRQYLGGVVFDPSGKASAGCLNLWTGMSVEPKRGSWRKMQRHIWKIICKRNKKGFRYLIYWMARMVQHPELVGYVCIVLRGLKGAGKGVFAAALLRIFASHCLHIREAEHITGKFNAHLQTCIFLFADEALFAGDKKHEGILKGLVTERTLEIEPKFRVLFEALNFLHVMMASNENWVVPATADERRFAVYDVADEAVGNREYFTALRREMEEEGGDAAMLDFLLHLDISKFDPADVPDTEGLQEQKKLTAPLHWKWFEDVLSRGYVLASKIGGEQILHQWFDNVTTNALYASYEAYVAKQRRNYPQALSREKFGEFLHGKDGLRLKKTQTTEALDGERKGSSLDSFAAIVMLNDRRHPAYKLGTLTEAREHYAKVTKFNICFEEEALGDPTVTDDPLDAPLPTTFEGKRRDPRSWCACEMPF